MLTQYVHYLIIYLIPLSILINKATGIVKHLNCKLNFCTHLSVSQIRLYF